MADDRKELRDGGIEAKGTMVGLAVDGHAAASPDDTQRKQETYAIIMHVRARHLGGRDMLCLHASACSTRHLGTLDSRPSTLYSPFRRQGLLGSRPSARALLEVGAGA